MESRRFKKPPKGGGGATRSRVLYCAGVGGQFGTAESAIVAVFERFGEVKEVVMPPDCR